jgi:hypothetical protein
MGACAQMFNFSISILLVQFMMRQYSSGLYSEPPPLMRHLPVPYGLLLAVPLPVSGAMQIPTQPENPFSHLFRFLFKQSILPFYQNFSKQEINESASLASELTTAEEKEKITSGLPLSKNTPFKRPVETKLQIHSQ